MSKIKELWQYPLFRWVCLLFPSLFVQVLVLEITEELLGVPWKRIIGESVIMIGSIVFLPPIIFSFLWVWRRWWGRMVLRLARWVRKVAKAMNKAAE